jgi:1,4-alpha-glucan branching enzyme
VTSPESLKPPESAIEALLQGVHADPFSLLGVLPGPDGTFLRAILPGAEEVEAFSLDGRRLGRLGKVDDRKAAADPLSLLGG